jgi:redox-sensitive bicupin YhaK (pirin superfamily)
MTVEVRRAASRRSTAGDNLVSRHSFSFGPHYDPGDVGHAVLVAHNDDDIRAGAGYDTHPHRDLEIVTWVLEGGLRHRDSDGNGGVVVPGRLQRLSAGSGVRHSEHHDPAHGPRLRFVQMWVLPDEPGLTPSYAQRDVGPALAGGELVPVASGRPGPGLDAAVPVHNRDATLHVARLKDAAGVQLPDAPYLHVFVARGSADLEAAGRLEEADAVRLTGAGGVRLTAAGECEVLVWEMHRATSLPDRP